MQFSRYPQALLVHHLQAVPKLQRPHPEQPENPRAERESTGAEKPPGLIETGGNAESDGGAGFLPRSQSAARRDAEPVSVRWEGLVDDPPRCARIRPALVGSP